MKSIIDSNSHSMNKNRKDIYSRNRLSDVVPLLTPYKVNIDVANACNFKCNFCFHGINEKELKSSNFNPGVMDYEIFEIIIRQIKEFPEKIKCIGLTGIGEPLLNRRLPDMIHLTKNSDITDKVIVTTNGSLLRQSFTDSLVNAGLDEIIISIEALNDNKYYDTTLAKVNFEELVSNINYLYENRGTCKVFIKILNIAFDEINDENRFHEIFDGISDMAYVEKVIPQFKPVDYDVLGLDYERTIYDKEILPIEVCSMIFYAMQIATSGNVCPCCIDYNETEVFGNVKTDNLYDIWNSSQFNAFRETHLNNKRNCIELCNSCEYFIYNIRDEDIIDESAKLILARMQEG